MVVKSRFSALLGCLLLSTLAWPGLAQVKELTLPNGLRLLTKEVHSAPVVSFYIWYRVGSRDERPGLTGSSHFLEHMTFRSSRHYPSQAVDRMVTERGGWANGMTFADCTAYVETLPSQYWELPFKLEAERMTNALILPQEMKTERTVVISEREGHENDPQSLLDEEVQAQAFKAHPYHWPVIGWKWDVQTVARDALYDYYRSYYQPANATVVVVGDIDTAKIRAAARKHFGSIPRRPVPPDRATREPPQPGERRVTIKGPAGANYVEMAFHVPTLDQPDNYALDVLKSAFTSGRSGRLYRALVETGLAASASAFYYPQRDPTLFEFFASLPAESSHQKAEEAILGEIERLKADPISDQELARAVNQARASFIFGQDSMSRQAYRLGYYASINDYRYLDTYVDRIKAVTKEDVRRVARTYLTAENRTVGWWVATGQAGAPAPASGVGGPVRRIAAPAATMPAVAPAPPVEKPVAVSQHPPTVRRALPNGVAVIVQENHANPTVAFNGNLKAGGLYDPPGKAGLASFTAQALSRGTTGRTSEQISDQLEFVAASLDFSASKQVVNFTGQALKEDLPLLVDLLADQLRHPTFPEDKIARLRGEIMAGLHERNDDPEQVAEDRFYQLLYPQTHPLHWPTDGLPETVKGIARQELVDFHSRYYRPDTLTLVVVGDVKADQVFRLAADKLGDWQVSGEAPPFGFPPAQQPEKPREEKATMPGKSQSEVALGFLGITRTDPDYPSAELMNYLLGGGFVSRLNNVIRDKQGLAYSVWSYFQPSYAQAPWVLRMGVNPRNVTQAVKSALEQIKLMRQAPPGQAELQLWKRYVSGRQAVRMETNAGIAGALMEAEFYHLGLEYPYRYPEIVGAVTPQQVQQAARKYLHPDGYALVVAGP